MSENVVVVVLVVVVVVLVVVVVVVLVLVLVVLLFSCSQPKLKLAPNHYAYSCFQTVVTELLHIKYFEFKRAIGVKNINCFFTLALSSNQGAEYKVKVLLGGLHNL